MFPILRRICSTKALETMHNISRQQKISYLYPNIKTDSLCATITPNNRQIRYKSKKGTKVPKQQVTESESESWSNDDPLDNSLSKHTKVMQIRVSSLRVDAILKSSLGISRNKIDVMFYENRIRINGEKIPKKNSPVGEGDEIDLIKNISTANPDNLIVARVEVLSYKALEDTVEVKIRRFKSLTVENYAGVNSWKA